MKAIFEFTDDLGVEAVSGAISGTAFAKINLYLHVVGNRVDGYHLINSLVAFVGIGDSLTVTPWEGLRLEIGGPFAAPLQTANTSENLVLRAARQLSEEAGVRADALISLEKLLPIAAGLGGGSADAATTLRALSNLWKIDISTDDMARLALKLGADVPVCLGGRASRITGIGEIIEPAPTLPEAYVILANPQLDLETARVYRELRREEWSNQSTFIEYSESVHALAKLLADCQNDLEQPAERLAPIITDVLANLSDLPDCLLARMSGSGATCFALFASSSAAEDGARQLSRQCPSWWIRAAPLVCDIGE